MKLLEMIDKFRTDVETVHNFAVVVVVGPTASGKSELAVRLAEKFDGEVVNADSMQVYRGMDIGTAKPSAELLQRAPHHLLSIVTPDVNFTAADFQHEARRVITEIRQRKKLPIVVGGSGLYIRALLGGLAKSPGSDEALRAELTELADREGNCVLLDRLRYVDPDTAARLHVNDRLRIIRALEVHQQSGLPFSSYQSGFAEVWCNSLKIGINVERSELYERINARVDQMIVDGFVAEIEDLISKGYSPELKSLSSIGYSEICGFIAGKQTLTEAIEKTKQSSRHYAKRQLTWFKKDPEVKWFTAPLVFSDIYGCVTEFLSSEING